MATAVADLHARLTADVRQYDSEMKRAAAVTQKTAATIEGQMGQLQKSIGRKWTMADIGKDVLKGFGLGSGFALAQTAAEALTDHYKRQADYAAMIEERTERQLEHTRAMISLGQSPEQRVDRARKDRETATKELSNIEANLQVSAPQYDRRGNRIADLKGRRHETEDESARIKKLHEEIRKADSIIKQDDVSKRAEAVAQIERDVSSYLKNTLQPQLKAEHELREAVSKRAGAQHELNEAHREAQELLRVEEINLGGTRTATNVRFDIGDDDEAHGRAAVREMMEERKSAAHDWAGRIERSGIRVDDMTRRGMGTGANYSDWTKTTNDLLKRIADILQRIEVSGPLTPQGV